VLLSEFNLRNTNSLIILLAQSRSIFDHFWSEFRTCDTTITLLPRSLPDFANYAPTIQINVKPFRRRSLIILTKYGFQPPLILLFFLKFVVSRRSASILCTVGNKSMSYLESQNFEPSHGNLSALFYFTAYSFGFLLRRSTHPPYNPGYGGSFFLPLTHSVCVILTFFFRILKRLRFWPPTFLVLYSFYRVLHSANLYTRAYGFCIFYRLLFPNLHTSHKTR